MFSHFTRDAGLCKLNLGIALMLSASSTSGYNASQINSLLVLPEFSKYLARLDSNTTGLIIAAVSLGSFLAFIPAAYVSDLLGRRVCVTMGASMAITAAIVQFTVHNHWVFFAARTLTGMALGMSQTGAPLLIAETAHPRQRRTLTGLYNSLWFSGSITASAITFATLSIHNEWSWRIPCLLQMFYPCLQLVGVLAMPESPRWLVAKGRKTEALEMLTRYHANGNPDSTLVDEEFDQICKSINAETHSSSASRWTSFLKTKGDVHRLMICIALGFMQEWTGNGVTSYYLAPILDSVGITKAAHQAAVNMSLQIWNLVFAVSGASVSDKYGRRVLWLSATTLMLIFLSASTLMAGLFTEMHIFEAGIAVVPMLFLFCSAYDFAYMPLFIAYPAEILPFQLRAKGLAITLTMDGLACFFNQYVNPVAFAALKWRYFSVYIGMMCMALVIVYFFFPETQGRSLEEVARIFERKKSKPEDRPVDGQVESPADSVDFEKVSFGLKV